MTKPLAPVRHILRAVATTVVPESTSLDERAWAEVEAVIDEAIAKRGPRIGRQITLFIRVLQLAPIARYGKAFTRLDPPRRVTFLEAIERSNVLLVRRGFWGVRTLIFMGYYTREDIAAQIGYRAHRDGWTARGGTFATVPLAPTLWVEP